MIYRFSCTHIWLFITFSNNKISFLFYKHVIMWWCWHKYWGFPWTKLNFFWAWEDDNTPTDRQKKNHRPGKLQKWILLFSSSGLFRLLYLGPVSTPWPCVISRAWADNPVTFIPPRWWYGGGGCVAKLSNSAWPSGLPGWEFGGEGGRLCGAEWWDELGGGW